MGIELSKGAGTHLGLIITTLWQEIERDAEARFIDACHSNIQLLVTPASRRLYSSLAYARPPPFPDPTPPDSRQKICPLDQRRSSMLENWDDFLKNVIAI